MGTNLRTELSSKNKYAIPKERRLELSHFCAQYREWCRRRAELTEKYNSKSVVKLQGDPNYKSIVEDVMEELYLINRNKEIVETCCERACPDLSAYILAAVTAGMSYETLKTRYNIPCSRNVFYTYYKKFFWELDKVRG